MVVANTLFKKESDDAAPVVAGDTYPAMQSVVVDTSATGDYVDKDGRSASNSAAVSVRIPNGDANAVISAGAEITVAEFALVEIVTAEQSSVGPVNALVYPVGDFTAIPVNDGSTGNNGAVYRLPSVDALQITMPNAADMNIAEGVYRVRVSADWANLAGQTTVPIFIDDTANGIDFGEGLPVEGYGSIDFVIDPAGDRWIATSGDTVTLDQIIPSYAEHVEVPANIRLYLANGTGGAAQGLYRKEHLTNNINFIG